MRDKNTDQRYFSWPDFIGAAAFGIILFDDLTGVLSGGKSGVPWIVFTAAMLGWMNVGFVVRLTVREPVTRVKAEGWAGLISGATLLLAFAPSLLNQRGWELSAYAAALVLGVLLVFGCASNLKKIHEIPREALEDPGERR